MHLSLTVSLAGRGAPHCARGPARAIGNPSLQAILRHGLPVEPHIASPSYPRSHAAQQQRNSTIPAPRHICRGLEGRHLTLT